MAERMVKCVKFTEELPGIDDETFEIIQAMVDEEVSRRIYENVSQKAWALWEEHLIILINEYRLVPFEKESDDFINEQMEQFFFGEGAALPPGYVPPQGKM